MPGDVRLFEPRSNRPYRAANRPPRPMTKTSHRRKTPGSRSL
jgi:hypothetical protein